MSDHHVHATSKPVGIHSSFLSRIIDSNFKPEEAKIKSNLEDSQISLMADKGAETPVDKTLETLKRGCQAAMKARYSGVSGGHAGVSLEGGFNVFVGCEICSDAGG